VIEDKSKNLSKSTYLGLLLFGGPY